MLEELAWLLAVESEVDEVELDDVESDDVLEVALVVEELPLVAELELEEELLSCTEASSCVVDESSPPPRSPCQWCWPPRSDCAICE